MRDNASTSGDFERLSGTVFVVDDDEAMRESLAFLLPSFGLDVRLFENAEAFLTAYDPAEPGCLLSDIRMPGMSGLELHDELRRRELAIPVVLTTAYSDVPTAVQSIRKGAIDFIEKPFDDITLFDCLRRALAADREQRSSGSGGETRSLSMAHPPEQVAQYRILRKLGEGGMSEVFLAEDTELRRQVALKFLHLHSRSDEDRARFRREAQAIAAVSHPNIVTVFQILEQGDRLCIAMEYLEGRTLRELIKARELDIEDALAIASQLAAGLTEAHRVGLIHRDVKPENVIVDSRGRAKLLDFGIVHIQSSPQVTGNEQMIGTPAYMAPEQALGDDADPRSDLFALGVVLYEMVSGRYPFEGDNPMRLLRAILHDPPRPLPPIDDERLPVVQRIIDKVLAKDPSHRHPDAETFCLEISAVAQSPTPPPKPRSPSPEGFRSQPDEPSHTTTRSAATESNGLLASSRRRQLLALAFVASGLVALVVALFLSSREEVSIEPETASSTAIAVLPFTVRGADDLAYLDHGLVELLSLKLDGAGTLRSVDPRALLSHFERENIRASQRARGPEIARRFNAGYYTHGSLVAVGQEVHLEVALYEIEDPHEPTARAVSKGSSDEILDLLDRVVAEILGEMADGPSPRLRKAAVATSSSLPAVKAFLRGEASFRDGLYEEALNAFQEAVEEDPDFALAHYRLCAVADWVARGEISARAASEAKRLSHRLSDHHRRLLEGMIAWRSGAAGEAERVYRAILGTYPDDVEAWFYLGEVLFHYGPRRGRSLDEARQAFERVAELEPEHVPALWHLARIAMRQGRKDRVAQLSEQIRQLQPDGDRLLEIDALEAFVLGDENAQQHAFDRLRKTRDLTLLITLWDLAIFKAERSTDPYREALSLATLVTEPSRSPEMRAWGHVAIAHLELAGGRRNDAFEAIDRAAVLDPLLAAEYRALLLLHPLLDPEPEQRRAAWSALEDARTRARGENTTPNVFLSVHNGAHDLVRNYLLGRLSLRDGKLDQAERHAETLRGVEGAERPENTVLATDLARGLRARIAFAREDDEKGLERLRRIQESEVWYGWSTVSPFFSRSSERYLLAQTLAESGQSDEATRLFGSFAEHSLFDLVYIAPSHLERAELYESQGQNQQAAHHYRRFLELWSTADDTFDPWLEKARQGLRRTGGANP